MKCFGVGVEVKVDGFPGTVQKYVGDGHWRVMMKDRGPVIISHEDAMERVDGAFGPNYPKEIRG